MQDLDGGWASERLAGRNISNPELRRHERCDLGPRLSPFGEAVSRSGSPLIPQCDGMDDDYDDVISLHRTPFLRRFFHNFDFIGKLYCDYAIRLGVHSRSCR